MSKKMLMLMSFIIGLGIGVLIVGSIFEREIQIIKDDCRIQSMLDHFDVLSNAYEK